jgi:transcriptional regulator with XRE-family HTH domain
MKKPNTRIGLLQQALKAHGVTEEKLAEMAGCGKPLVQKWKLRKGTVAEQYAIRIANETGVDLHWLLGQYRMLPILGRFRTKWTPEIYKQIQDRKHDPETISQEADLCGGKFLEGVDQLARVILAGFKSKKSALAIDRINVALQEIALEFGADQHSQEAIDQRAEIRLRHLNKKELAETACELANRFARELKAIQKDRPVKKSAKNSQRSEGLKF